MGKRSRNKEEQRPASFFDEIINGISGFFSSIVQVFESIIEGIGNIFSPPKEKELASEDRGSSDRGSSYSSDESSILYRQNYGFATNIVLIENLRDGAELNLSESTLRSFAKDFFSDYIENGAEESFFRLDDEDKFNRIREFVKSLAKDSIESIDDGLVSNLLDNSILKKEIIKLCNETALQKTTNSESSDYYQEYDASRDADEYFEALGIRGVEEGILQFIVLDDEKKKEEIKEFWNKCLKKRDMPAEALDDMATEVSLKITERIQEEQPRSENSDSSEFCPNASIDFGPGSTPPASIKAEAKRAERGLSPR